MHVKCTIRILVESISMWSTNDVGSRKSMIISFANQLGEVCKGMNIFQHSSSIFLTVVYNSKLKTCFTSSFTLNSHTQTHGKKREDEEEEERKRKKNPINDVVRVFVLSSFVSASKCLRL